MKISCSFLWQEIWSGRYIRDVLYFRICSVLEEVFYIKGKVHENTIFQVQARQRKFICYMSCTFPYLAKLRKCQFWSSAVKCFFHFLLVKYVYACCCTYTLKKLKWIREGWGEGGSGKIYMSCTFNT